MYLPNDSSETSHSRRRVKRKVISSIDGKISGVSVMPSARTMPWRDLAHVLVVADREREMQRCGAAAGDDLRRTQIERRCARAVLSLHLAFLGGHGRFPVVARYCYWSTRATAMTTSARVCARQMPASGGRGMIFDTTFDKWSFAQGRSPRGEGRPDRHEGAAVRRLSIRTFARKRWRASAGDMGEVTLHDVSKRFTLRVGGAPHARAGAQPRQLHRARRRDRRR